MNHTACESSAWGLPPVKLRGGTLKDNLKQPSACLKDFAASFALRCRQGAMTARQNRSGGLCRNSPSLK